MSTILETLIKELGELLKEFLRSGHMGKAEETAKIIIDIAEVNGKYLK